LAAAGLLAGFFCCGRAAEQGNLSNLRPISNRPVKFDKSADSVTRVLARRKTHRGRRPASQPPHPQPPAPRPRENPPPPLPLHHNIKHIRRINRLPRLIFHHPCPRNMHRVSDALHNLPLDPLRMVTFPECAVPQRLPLGDKRLPAYLPGSRECHPFIKASSASSTAPSSLDCANAGDARMAAMLVRRVICTFYCRYPSKFYCDHPLCTPVTRCISERTRTAPSVQANGCHEGYRNHIRSSNGSRPRFRRVTRTHRSAGGA
jgi:hypothetical protein